MSEYADLPPDLRGFWSVEITHTAEPIRNLINDGWAIMSEQQRVQLVLKLKTETDSIQRVLVASQEATNALLS